MGFRLVIGDEQRYDVELLTDTPPDWKGLKVTAPGSNLTLSVGTIVQVESDSTDQSGQYRVSRRLGPAAPRGWRFFLEPADAVVSGEPNNNKLFAITFSSGEGTKVRKSIQEIKVPFERLSTTVQRITKSGGKINHISESGILS